MWCSFDSDVRARLWFGTVVRLPGAGSRGRPIVGGQLRLHGFKTLKWALECHMTGYSVPDLLLLPNMVIIDQVTKAETLLGLPCSPLSMYNADDGGALKSAGCNEQLQRYH
jgi:hypothetical protein